MNETIKERSLNKKNLKKYFIFILHSSFSLKMKSTIKNKRHLKGRRVKRTSQRPGKRSQSGKRNKQCIN